jgi:pantoate--beta-alanine ligase
VDVFTSTSGLGRFAGNVLVPTMGALHAGHAALIKTAATLASDRSIAAGCVVTIFVNPTQFNEKSDFDRYPRTLDADLAICRDAGAAAVFAPVASVVYPPGRTIDTPPLPTAATRPGLEDRHRPGHFAGVCQVVNRLFDLTAPSIALFGEKDWQQLAVISGMTTQQGLPIEIRGVPTVREPSGLAMSSRNVFLSSEDRSRAVAISKALVAAGRERDPASGEKALARILAASSITPEYAVIRRADTLEPLTPDKPAPGRALIAARVGNVRLIDNGPWPSAPG